MSEADSRETGRVIKARDDELLERNGGSLSGARSARRQVFRASHKCAGG